MSRRSRIRGSSRAPIIAAVCFVLSSHALAFQGRLVRPDGTPVSDATVTIAGLTGATRTDEIGRFRWEPDPTPPFKLLVELPGGQYAAPVMIESIPADRPLDITVEPAGTDAVRVTADAAPHIQAPPASAVVLLTREDLEQRHPPRLIDALENVPGVGRVGGGHETVPSIRGLARGRSLILVDGARVITERRAGPSATWLDPFFLEAVEISRGPGSVAYGSDALGGIIHARTRQARPGDPFRTRVTGSAGTGLPVLSAGAELSKGLEEGGVIFQARWRRFGDFDSPEGEVPNSEATDHGFLARLDHEIGPGRLSLGWQTDTGREIERPALNSATNRVSEPREDSHRLTFSYQLEPMARATLIGINGFVGSYRLVTEQDVLDIMTGRRDLFGSDVRARDVGLRAAAVQPLKRARLEAGLDLNGRYDLEALGSSPLGEERPIEEAHRADSAVYLTGEGSHRRLTIAGGIRYDRVTTRNRGGFFGDRSTKEGSASGFAAVTAGPYAGLSFTGQIARGFRDPTLSDRYFRGVSGRGFVTGSPGLRSESSFQIDAAVRFAGRRLRAGLFAYDYRIDDLVERFEMDQDPGTGLDAFFFRNRGEGRLRGVELEVTAEIATHFVLVLAAQASRGRDEEGSDLDDGPARGAVMQARRQVGDRGYLLARAGVYAQDDDAGPSEVPTPAYATLDLGGGLRAGRHLELRIQVKNLFDRTYPASADSRSTLAAGRSALLTLVASVGG